MWLGMWLGLASIPLVDDMQIFEKCSCIENAASVGSWEPIREAHHCSCSKRAHLHLTLTTVTREKTLKPLSCGADCCKEQKWTHTVLTLILSSSVQLLSRVQLFATPWTAAPPGFTVHHQLPEFTQSHVHWVGDAIQPSHPLLCPSPPTFNLSQRQGLFQSVSSSHQVAKVLEFQLQHQSFQWTPRADLF